MKRLFLVAIMLICALTVMTACNDVHTHKYSDKWTNDETSHWHKCEGCEEITGKTAHNYGDDDICDDCKYKKGSSVTPDEHEHSMIKHEAKEATEEQAGNSLYYECKGCGKYFSDREGKNEIEDKESVIIPKKEHEHTMQKHEAKDATCTEDGNIEYYECTKCKNLYLDEEGNEATEKESVTKPSTGHTESESWEHDDTYHWHNCEICGTIINQSVTLHNYGDDGLCNECRYKRVSKGLAFTFDTNNDSYTITGMGTCDDAEIVIPDTYDNKLVTGIGNNAFKNHGNITSVEISNNITSIGDSAFSGCGSLMGIEIPSSITSIGNNAFSGCNGLLTIEVDAENENYYSENNCLIEKATQTLILGCRNSRISSNVKSIGAFAFYGCDSLTSIEIPNSITSIGNSAFSGCPIIEAKIPTLAIDSIPISDLKTVIITSGDSIGDHAFEDCRNLTSIDISSSVSSIGVRALSGCGKLQTVTITDDSKLSSISERAFYECGSLSSIKIPSEVMSIGDSAFSGCAKLQTLTIADDSKLTSIEERAFYECGSLSSIKIPSEVMSIGDSAFNSCAKLQTVTITDGSKLSNISARAFYECGSLSSIKIPSGVMSIEDSAFSGCGKLQTVTIADESKLTSIGERAFYECGSITSIKIPSSVTSMGLYVFNDCAKLQSVIFAEECNLTSIEGGVFCNCGSLLSIEIPSSMTSIGNSAFLNSGLTSVKIPSGVTSIGIASFNGCSGLTSIEIPSSVKNIGMGAFYLCDKLQNVYFHGTASEWEEIIIDNSQNYNSSLNSATRYYYSANDPKLSDDYNSENNYYHYNDDGEIVVWKK